MKNKIFELYKPNSLAEFLDFYKKNPEGIKEWLPQSGLSLASQQRVIRGK